MKANRFFLVALIISLWLFSAACSDEDRTLKSIQIEPGYLQTYLDAPSKHFSATGRYSDGDKADITDEVTWSCGSLPVASGTVTFSHSGDFTLSASYSGDSSSGAITGSAAIKVVGYLQSVSIGFDNITSGILKSVSAGVYEATSDSSISARFSAMGHYSDDSTLDITNAATWSYNSSNNGALDPTGDIKGQVYLNKVGSFQITAAVQDPNSSALMSGRIVVNITAP